jgi:S-DNA-T family DNA segregation ATPase FtsK/SpoIIIE
MNPRHLNEIKGIVVIAAGLLIFLGLSSYSASDIALLSYPVNYPLKNLIRVFGAWMSFGLFFAFGWISYSLPAVLFFWGAAKFKGRLFFEPFRFPGLVLLAFSLSSLVGLTSNAAETSFERSGLLGLAFSQFLSTYFGAGSWIIAIMLVLLSCVLVMEFLVSSFVVKIIEGIKAKLRLPAVKFNLPRLKNKEKEPAFAAPAVQARVKSEALPKAVSTRALRDGQAIMPDSKEEGVPARIELKINDTPKQNPAIRPKSVQLKAGTYQLPPLDLLEESPASSSRKALEEDLTGNAHILEDTLLDFGISARVANIERGPAITRYELEPAPGVKVVRIVSLSDDIALAMKAQSVRIVAPIPGKNRVGIEVPNTSVGAVYLREIFSSQEFQEAKSKLTLALGKDITGRAVVSDLGDMPHILIAGTTGSGKTVCVNSLILSVLYRATPEEVKFLMVDPKMVEMSVYNGLPHLLCPVVTDAKKVSSALGWLVSEMEERYKLLARVAARNIESYNQKEERLPYIVVVIDELADLMMVAANQIENAITRLAQLSRAVGIHLILATQRPSVDVITGVIKANFPARISFKVASKVDSRTVLDANGADKLLGKGDMLFMRPGESKLIRAQGSFLKDAEIERVVKFINAQAEPVYEESILKAETKSLNIAEREKDALFDEAVRLILESNQASVSILQRRLMLGYARAARLIDSMEQEGIVGPYQGSKPRKILVDRQEWLKERGISLSLDTAIEEEEAQ